MSQENEDVVRGMETNLVRTGQGEKARDVAGTVRFIRWKPTELCIGNREESVETLVKPVVPVGGRKKATDRPTDGRTDGQTDGREEAVLPESAIALLGRLQASATSLGCLSCCGAADPFLQ